MISLDLETHLIARAQSAPRPVCMTWQRPGEKPGLLLWSDSRTAANLLEWLSGPELIIGANTAFDLGVIAEYLPWTRPLIFAKLDRGEIHDIQINQKLIDIATVGNTDREYNLGALAERYGLPAMDKAGFWRMEYERLERVQIENWPQGAIDYVLADVDRPLLIHAQQMAWDARWKAKSGYPALHLAGREARKSFALHLITCWGVMTDPAATAKLKRRMERYLKHGQHWLMKKGMVREDQSKDTKAAKAFMLETMAGLGLPVKMTEPAKNRKSKKPFVPQVSLDKEACEASQNGLLKLYSAFSQADSLLSRVEDMCQGTVLPLQTSFDPILKTGRTSARKPTPPLVGVQSQNMPRSLGARECCVPRKGHVLGIADFEGAESHSLAQVNYDLFGFSVMRDLLNGGRDLHKWFAGQILGLEYEAFLEWEKKDPKAAKLARGKAKPPNFGFPGGMGGDTFQAFAWSDYKVRFTLEEAEELRLKWLAAFPEMAQFFKYINKLMGKRGGKATFRHIRSGRWRGQTPYCATCNSQFQELTATAASDALAEVQRLAYSVRSSALWNCRVLFYTHDEIVLEIPEEMGHDAVMELSVVMGDRFNALHPDCPTTAPGCLSLVYSKDAKAVYGTDGKLVPWELAA